ncbi:MAG: hypothetical protein V4482_06680 [Pseudomonadota bacterium]
MNKYSKSLCGGTLSLLVAHEVCFASELPDDQRAASLSHVVNHVHFSQTPDDSQQNTMYANQSTYYPAVHQINKQLHDDYGVMNPNIQLAPATYEEISHISMLYESSPKDFFYNSQKNQVRLVWKTDKASSLLWPKKKTFALQESDDNLTIAAAELTPTTVNSSIAPSVNSRVPVVIDIINRKLRDLYGRINPNIQLSLVTYNEISHISMQYESGPEDILYNRQKNQVRFIWKNRNYCSIFRLKRKTFDLARVIIVKPAVSDTTVAMHPVVEKEKHVTFNIDANRQYPVVDYTHISNVQQRPITHPAHIHNGQIVQTYRLTQSAAELVFGEWFNRLEPRYKGNYLETSEYNRLITDLRKNGIASLNVYIEHPNSWYLLAIWQNHQQRLYQLWGLR